MFERLLSQGLASLFCGAVGVLVGATMVRTHDDHIIAKSVQIVDDDGKQVMMADSGGLIVDGENKGDSTLIKAGARPTIIFTRDSATSMEMGILGLTYSGLTTFHDGEAELFLGSGALGGQLMITPETGLPPLDKLFTKRPPEDAGAISLRATKDSAEIQIYAAGGKLKVIKPDDGAH